MTVRSGAVEHIVSIMTLLLISVIGICVGLRHPLQPLSLLRHACCWHAQALISVLCVCFAACKLGSAGKKAQGLPHR